MDTRTTVGAAPGPDPSGALDASALDRLRARAASDPRGAARAAAVQFEAMFLQKVLEGMREAGPRGGMFGGDAGSGMAAGMLDRQLSTLLAGRPGGLADAIASRLAGALRGRAPAIEAAAVGTAGGVGSGGTGVAPGSGGTGSGQRGGVTDPVSRPPAPSAAVPLPAADGARAGGDRRAAFVDRVWAHAVDAQRATGVRAEFVVGQAALESGWGRGEIRHADGRASHNVFGIKAGRDWTGPTVDTTTTEWIDGRPQKRVERFRAYESYAEAFRDWVGLVGRRARYAGVLRDGGSAEGFAAGMQRAGYATDPRYAEKLGGAIRAAQALRRTIA